MAPESQPRDAAQRVLITGGAGFIGTRLARALSREPGRRITLYDNLSPQVHGDSPTPPDWSENVELCVGDVRDGAALAACVAECAPDAVFHLAAETGTGQSDEEISRYCDVNVGGTARLLEALRERAPACRHLVLAGSRAIYGEGAHRTPGGRHVVPDTRALADLERGVFAPHSAAGEALEPTATDETSQPSPASVYASTKLMQELLVRQAGRLADWTPVILRLQNVYGAGQSLHNPYTGVLAIFCAQILSGERLRIYEDGAIVRDFLHIDDAVRAFEATLGTDAACVLNVGSGRPATILEAARLLLCSLGAAADGYDVTGEFRPGDIRHALADISRAERVLGWKPEVALEAGLAELAGWARTELGS